MKPDEIAEHRVEQLLLAIQEAAAPCPGSSTERQPSIRSLARQLRMSKHTVVTYADVLEARGKIERRRGHHRRYLYRVTAA